MTRAKGKPKRTTLKKKADRLFSELVRQRRVCESCGVTDPGRLQCAHGFTRSYLNTRWDERNAFCLCSRCHVWYTHRPLEWDEFLIERWGSALYQELRQKALDTQHKVDYEAVIERLTKELAA